MQSMASECPVPVVLVHGWKSHPKVWAALCTRLDEVSIMHWNFSHARMNVTPAEIAVCLQEFIHEKREISGHSGPVDIICHSAGTAVVRYLLEVLDKPSRREQIRQLIALGPPNNGSAMAELFHHPTFAPDILRMLSGVFVPRDYDPSQDIMARELCSESHTMLQLREAGTRNDIRYRLILTENRTGTPALFPYLNGQTWAHLPNGDWVLTYAGDGVIPHIDSYLAGAEVDILPLDSERFTTSPDEYSHIALPYNGEVIDRILAYLLAPTTPSGAVCGNEWANKTGIPPWTPENLLPDE
jgi:triacylglycerol lipase